MIVMQTEKKSAQTAATVLDTKSEHSQAQENHTAKALKSQLWDSLDDLRCLRDSDLDDMRIVLGNLLGDLTQDASAAENTIYGSRLAYYAALIRIWYNMYTDRLSDISCVIRNLETLWDCMKGGAAQ